MLRRHILLLVYNLIIRRLLVINLLPVIPHRNKYLAILHLLDMHLYLLIHQTMLIHKELCIHQIRFIPQLQDTRPPALPPPSEDPGTLMTRITRMTREIIPIRVISTDNKVRIQLERHPEILG